MELAIVRGQVVSTVKDRATEGYKLLVVERADVDGTPLRGLSVAIDAVGAGEGELVLIVRGSSARAAAGLAKVPTDATVVGIVDEVTFDGKRAYLKSSAVDAPMMGAA